MLDKSDYQIIAKYKKRYRASCNLCGIARGYLTEDGSGLCYSCAITKRNIGHGFAAIDDKINDGEQTKYRAYCSTCGKDRGYVRSRNIGKSCASCAASIRNKKRYKSADPLVIAHRHLRQIIKSAISRKMRLRGSSKNGQSITKVLPYSVAELKTSIESKFQPGMSWDNYGEWEIDHRIPDSWFEYSSVTDPAFIASWSLANLQPKWKHLNRQKSNKFAD